MKIPGYLSTGLQLMLVGSVVCAGTAVSAQDSISDVVPSSAAAGAPGGAPASAPGGRPYAPAVDSGATPASKSAVASWQASTTSANNGTSAVSSFPPSYPLPKKQPGPLRKLLKSAADEVGGTAAALIDATIGDTDINLPPDTEDNPSWPFRSPHSSALYTVYWTNGSSAKISKTPEGSYCVTGGGHCITLQKEPGGVFAMLGEDGTMGTLTPRLDGGYTLIRSDGTSAMLLPRQGGGFNVVNEKGTIATIIPGPGRSRHVFTGSL